ncbi:MAG TPA: DUF2877 domain-containing protein [Micromonosporaceae bacterium]|nr:DUF2877 domain-containing protein [Micromonosporaceae bacterium]
MSPAYPRGVLRVGMAAAEVLAAGATGRVIAVFRRAVYVAFPPGLVTLVPADAEPGPLHVHVAELPPAAVGDPARAAGDLLTVAGVRLGGGAPVWRPPPLPDPGGIAATLRAVVAHTPDLDLNGGPGPARADRLRSTLRRGGVAGAAAVLAGRGGGMTPAGDDLLAGVLLVARARHPHAEEALVGIARGADTHAISRAFLEQSARGRSLAAVHDLIGACADGDAAAARRARHRLAGVGATSGLDLAYGLLAGATTPEALA